MGSANVQAAILTKQIEELSTHLKKHKKIFIPNEDCQNGIKRRKCLII